MTDKLWLGRTVKELLSSDYCDKLSRHAASLRRELSALLKELREMQARRHDAAQGEKDQPSPLACRQEGPSLPPENKVVPCMLASAPACSMNHCSRPMGILFRDSIKPETL
jgi:hypothetical protein